MKKVLPILLIIILIAGAVYWYVFHKPHRDLQNEDTAYSLNAPTLVQEFSANQAMADSLYVDQLIALRGVISELEDRALILAPGVYCSLDSTATMPSLKVGDSVALRGRVLSYDELFEEVKMDYVLFED